MAVLLPSFALDRKRSQSSCLVSATSSNQHHLIHFRNELGNSVSCHLHICFLKLQGLLLTCKVIKYQEYHKFKLSFVRVAKNVNVVTDYVSWSLLN